MPLLILHFLGLVLTVALCVRLLTAAFSARVRQNINKHPWQHVIIICLVGIFWLAPWQSVAGSLAARADAYRGHYRLYITPSPARISEQICFREILRERYGIAYTPALGCMSLPGEASYMRAYDAAMRPAINTRFGVDAVVECQRAAIAMAAEKHRPPAP